MHLMRLPSTYYKTRYGAAYLGDSFDLIRSIPGKSINLVMTSPPFGLVRKKAYGNVDAPDYVNWFLPLAEEIKRVLADDGSFVLDLGGSWTKGVPTRSLYVFELLIQLCRTVGFHLAQEFFWYNPAKLPSPAEWVTVRRVRVKDAVNTVWWLSKSENPKADNKKVLQPYSDSMKQLLKNGYRAKLRPSGHDISTKFSLDNGGAIPPNLLTIANTESNGKYLRLCREEGIKPHPARFPVGLPSFFTKFLTDESDTVLDPFAGSNVTGRACEDLRRKWISFELSEEYIRSSQFRFEANTTETKRPVRRRQLDQNGLFTGNAQPS